MTQFIDKSKEAEKANKETVFTKYFNPNGNPDVAINKPSDYKFVEYIGHDDLYGDVFKAYNDSKYFLIYIGIKGTEFDD